MEIILRCYNCSSPMVSIQSILVKNKNQDWNLKVERNTDVFFQEGVGVCMKIKCHNCSSIYTKIYENKAGSITTHDRVHRHYTNDEL